MTSSVHADDFDVAKAIVEHVKDLPPERQERVFRWVAESLGLPSTLMRPVAPVLTSASKPITASSADSSPLPDNGTDIKSFIAAKAPKSDVQFATAAAYYYRFEAPGTQRKEVIDGGTLQEAARQAGRMRLGDPRKTLANATRSGYLDNVARGEFSINSVGENLVAMTLPGMDVAPNGRQAKRSKSTKKKL